MAKKNSENDNNTSVLELEDILARPVAPAPSPAEFFEPIIGENSDQLHEQAVFDEPEIIEVHEVPENNDTEQGFLSPKSFADMLVRGANSLQTSLLPLAIEKRMFSDRERELLADLDTTGTTKYNPNSDEAKALKKWRYYQDKVKLVPFSAEEAKSLSMATAQYLKEVNLQVTPFQGLCFAWGQVLVVRGGLVYM